MYMSIALNGYVHERQALSLTDLQAELQRRLLAVDVACLLQILVCSYLLTPTNH